MKTNIDNKQTISSLIGRSFVFSTLLILLITSVTAIYFNQRSLQEKRDSNLQKIHQILSNLIIPELTISNTSEIRRLLQLASNQDESFIVIDSKGVELMPDYGKSKLLESVRDTDIIKHCQSVHTFERDINGNKYWVTCSPLIRDDVLSDAKQFGILLTFSKYKWLMFSHMMFYFIGIAVLTLILVIIWFRQVLYKCLLKPTMILGSRIADKTKSPLTIDPLIGDIGVAPKEIITIKHSFETVLSNLQTEYQQRTESDKKAALFDLVAQLSHDIRSPLSVIEMTLKSYSKYVPQGDIDIQREAIQSVRNIFVSFLDRYREPVLLNNVSDELSQDDDLICRPIFLYPIIEQMISQKNQEWKENYCQINLSVDSDAKFYTVNAVASDIKRILSNLLNNAHESLRDKRIINLKLVNSSNFLKLHISDTGIGIAEENLKNVLDGLSSKHKGKGLGLSSSKNILENMGGKLELNSALGLGTEVILSFQKALKPSWLPTAIQIQQNASVVILDDDPSIHSLWRQRLVGYSLHHFLNTTDLFTWHDQNLILSNSSIFLVDYSLRDDLNNGLELMKRLDLKSRGYLITSHAENLNIQKLVEQAGVWLVPKFLISDFPLHSY